MNKYQIDSAAFFERMIFILTVDDVLLRNEWGGDVPTISYKEIETEADLKVLDLCNDLGISATVFIPAIVAKRFPRIMRSISRKRFEVAGHGYKHENFRNLSLSRQRHLIESSLKSIEETIGKEVTGWRSPGLLMNSRIRKAIEQSRISWCSNVVLPSWLGHVPFTEYGRKVEIPITSVDYNMYEKGFPPHKVLQCWLKDFYRVHSRESYRIFTLVIHPWVEVHRKERLEALRTFLHIASSKDNVHFLTGSDVYKCYLSSNVGSCYRAFLRVASKLIHHPRKLVARYRRGLELLYRV